MLINYIILIQQFPRTIAFQHYKLFPILLKQILLQLQLLVSIFLFHFLLFLLLFLFCYHYLFSFVFNGGQSELKQPVFHILKVRVRR